MTTGSKSKIKSEVVTFNVRLSGDEQVQIHENLKKIEERTGRTFAEVVRAILQIGIESFNAGSNIGFDGKVILATERKVEDSSNKPNSSVDETSKKLASKFID